MNLAHFAHRQATHMESYGSFANAIFTCSPNRLAFLGAAGEPPILIMEEGGRIVKKRDVASDKWQGRVWPGGRAARGTDSCPEGGSRLSVGGGPVHFLPSSVLHSLCPSVPSVAKRPGFLPPASSSIMSKWHLTPQVDVCMIRNKLWSCSHR